MTIDLNVPDHNTLARRNTSLKIKLIRVGKPRRRVDLVIFIHGDRRWTKHKHGKRKRCGWWKVHIVVNCGSIAALVHKSENHI